MYSNHRFVVALVALAALSTGCTHSQLRYNHVNQAKTLTGIYEKQVLDNLAMFKSNKEALPFFAVPKAGSTDVNDTGSLTASPLNGPAHTVLGLSALSRGNKEGWTITPIADPGKLTLMRCAYRRAIGMANPNDRCINCCEEQRAWKGEEVCCSCCAIRPLKIETCGTRFAHNPCEKVGTYCGTHIRVCPESYDDFTRLVLTILDYAVNEKKKATGPAQAEYKRYHYKIDQNGNTVIDYVDTFMADAQPLVTDRKDKDGKLIEIIPKAFSTSGLIESDGVGNLLEEAIRQRNRATLFPQ